MNPGVLNPRAVFPPKFQPLSRPEIAAPNHAVKRSGEFCGGNLLMNPGVLNPRAVFPPKFQPLSRPEIAAPNHAVKRRGEFCGEIC